MSESRLLTIKNGGIVFTLSETTIDRLGFNIAGQMTERALMEWMQLSDDERREAVIAATIGSIQPDVLKKAVASTLDLPADEVFIPRKKGAGK